MTEKGDYFIKGTIFKMLKSRYRNFDKRMESSGFAFNYVSRLTIKCTRVMRERLIIY